MDIQNVDKFFLVFCLSPQLFDPLKGLSKAKEYSSKNQRTKGDR